MSEATQTTQTSCPYCGAETVAGDTTARFWPCGTPIGGSERSRGTDCWLREALRLRERVAELEHDVKTAGEWFDTAVKRRRAAESRAEALAGAVRECSAIARQIDRGVPGASVGEIIDTAHDVLATMPDAKSGCTCEDGTIVDYETGRNGLCPHCRPPGREPDAEHSPLDRSYDPQPDTALDALREASSLIQLIAPAGMQMDGPSWSNRQRMAREARRLLDRAAWLIDEGPEGRERARLERDVVEAGWAVIEGALRLAATHPPTCECYVCLPVRRLDGSGARGMPEHPTSHIAQDLLSCEEFDATDTQTVAAMQETVLPRLEREAGKWDRIIATATSPRNDILLAIRRARLKIDRAAREEPRA